MTPAFIVGADRSGTTLLRLIVNGHSQLAVPAETWFLIDLIEAFGQHAQLDRAGVEQALALISAKRRWRNFTTDLDDIRHALFGDESVTLAKLFDAIMCREIAPTGKPRWIDKTPEYVLHLDDLATLFPSAQFINITRDGRDVFRSLKTQRWRGRTPWRIGRYWAACIEAARSAGETLPPDRWISVKYEDLVLDTESTVRQVCDFVGVPFEGAMLEFHASAADHVVPESIERGFHSKLLRPPEKGDAYRWRNEPEDWQSYLFESIVREQLIAVGYEPRLGSAAARWLRPMAGAHHGVASALVKVGKAVRRRAPA